MTQPLDLPAEDVDFLISSHKVDGTPVRTRDGVALGAVSTFKIDRRTGQVTYVVLRIGGLLGIGQTFYPVPWSALTYDAENVGYVVSIDKRLLEGGPSFSGSTEPVFDRAYAGRVSSYYASVA
ncbi:MULTISPECIES: PRC-barrel domain-containing protein [Sphingomonas]|uniref:Sporulation protein YlmC with PRC-barrel domain n=2 Tax=Sphingomonas TaxID=13687 RepID=A0A7W9BU39_9SPHN|nr:PRC-barrel domain-containing protein [Sphingomonas prati]MBB5730155.1 sporulation protein YlmC with PRC-barrel domain [Sphingomonas prati]GGE91921.1 photosystem reaction center subunit H [Sphingomonas prati]